MIRKAFIQKQYGDWLNDNCYSSANGFARMGFDVIGFEMNELETLDIKKTDVVHGGINTVRKVFDMLGVEQPPIHHPQDYLPTYCNRSFIETTLGDIRDCKYPFPFFIKPLVDHKLFTGFVVNNKFLDLLKIRHLDDNVKVVKSEYIKMLSEYRCFVLENKIVGCKNYTGDFKLFPDFTVIESAIKSYTGQPKAYSIDFAITESNETVLIEINDGFALGSYGLNPIIYCKMILTRWEEIMGLK